MKKIIETIFSVKNKDCYKVITILGIKFKFKNKSKMLSEIDNEITCTKKIISDAKKEVSNIKNEILNIKNEILNIKNKNKGIQNNISKVENMLSKDALPKLCFIDKSLRNSREFYWERYILPNKFYSYLDNGSIKDDYLNLIKNLDDESILNVQKVLARIQKIKATNSNICFWTDDERKEFNTFQSNYQEAIVQLDENIWGYKDYLLPTKFFDVSVFYFKHHIDKFKNIDFSKSVIDAGASVGDSAVFFSKFIKGNIYSFEPSKPIFKMLQKTIEINNLKNVFAYKAGFLDKETDEKIYYAGLEGQSTTINDFRDTGDNSELVHFTTIDKFVKENNLEVGLIKVDVEGAEPKLLEGAIETIKTQKPALIISIYHGAEDFFKIKPMLEELNLGYKFQITKPTFLNMSVETCLLAEVVEK